MVVATTVNDLYDKCEIRCGPNKSANNIIRKGNIQDHSSDFSETVDHKSPVSYIENYIPYI